ALRPRQVSHGRRSDDACALYFDFGQSKTGRKRVSNPAARFTRILPDYHSLRPVRQMISESMADGKNSLPVKRLLSSYAANCISSKKFSQLSTVLVLSQLDCRSTQQSALSTQPNKAIGN